MLLLLKEVVQIILRESEDSAEDYVFVKNLYSRRFQLSAETFRAKFAQHQRRTGSKWEDFSFELRSYVESWIEGLGVED